MEEQRVLFDHPTPWCTRCPAVSTGLHAVQLIGVRSSSISYGYLPDI
jgi:hypothetical protein